MFWAPMLAMGGLGLLQGAQAQRDQKKHNLAAAESTRYSSWSKQNPMQQRFGAPTAAGSALQGAVGGLALSQQLGSPGEAGGFSGTTAGAMKPSMGGSGETAMTNGGNQGYWQSMLRRSLTGE